MTGDFTIRSFETTEEYRACVELQEETWGVGFSERVPSAILKVSQILGGVSAGAYDVGNRLVGFVFGMTGLRDGEVVHWSDMLAVRPEARDAGLGRRLKEYQREQVLSRGVRTMFWTFDPLQSRNAHLNVTRLGAVVREYRENMYGDTDSPLHRGIGTDRFVALWQLDSDRVRTRLERAAVTSDENEEPRGLWPDPAAFHLALEADTSSPLPRPGDVVIEDADFVAVRIPSDIGGLMTHDVELARAWRVATRRVFRYYLESGLEVRAFQRGPTVSTYYLKPVRLEST